MSLDLNYDFLDRVRRVAALYTKRKTSDLLEGDYRSMQHGRSLDFDDLREYRYGDDVNYIDWKSSSRAGKTLIRRYFADRKHDVLFIGDTGKKMTGDTPAGESKEQIALMAFGVAAYLLGKQGVNYALSCCGSEGGRISSFTSGPMHLEELITGYKEAIECGNPAKSFYDTVADTAAVFSRHMVMIIITDAEGLAAAVPDDCAVATPDAHRIEGLLAERFGTRYAGGIAPDEDGLRAFAEANPAMLKPEPLPIYLNPAVRE